MRKMLLLVALLAACGVRAVPVGDGLNGDRVDFDVTLDGKALPIEVARDSAFPLNQVWPGYERPISQSRLDAFVRFDLARPATLEVKVPAGVEAGEVKLRPYGRGEILQVRDGVARVRLDRPQQAVLEFGAGRPQLHVFADPPFAHVPAADEIYFGPGVHEAGLICPTNGQTVCLDAGATVYGALLLEGVTNVTVTGRGILDSSRIRRVSSDGRYLRRLSAEEKAKLVDVTAFMCRASENVRVEGVVFRDSPFWVLIFRDDCRHVVVDNVKVVGQWRYNSDGIDICGCKDVAVRNSFIRSFDDSFVVRDAFCGGEAGAARGIVCEDCLLWCDWGCNVKAQLSFADDALIEQVKVRRCVFAEVQAMGVIIAARPGGRNGVIRDVAVEDVELDLSDVRLRQRLQHKENPAEAYVPAAQTNLTLFVVNNYDLRNRPLERISLLYDRLAFRRFKALGGPYEAAVAKVQLTAGKEEVRDFVAEDLPPRFFLSKKATFTTSAR